MKIIFISPCFNASKNLKNLIESVRSQKDDRWFHVFIDDISTDDTQEEFDRVVGSDERFSMIKNDEKKYALRNIVEVARQYQDEKDTIIAVIDGDDQLCNEDTVSLLMDQYEKGNDVVWTGHRWDINGINISRDMPKNVDPYGWPWCTSHLRTFRSTLLSKISDSNFKNHQGEWFQRGYDQALMLPLLKLTQKRKYIDEICYLYNIDSVSVNDRDWAEMNQLSTINLVRARGFLS
jgi:glycosyltransferase involved in cell wall biosynthesis